MMECFVLLRKILMRVGDVSVDDRVESWNYVGGHDWLPICNALLVIWSGASGLTVMKRRGPLVLESECHDGE